MQHANCINRITLPSVACPFLPFSPTIPHKPHDFRKKVTEHKMCVFLYIISLLE